MATRTLSPAKERHRAARPGPRDAQSTVATSAPIFPLSPSTILALDLADRIARERLSRGYPDLTPEEKAAVDGAVALDLKANRYDPASGTLAMPAGAAEAFDGLVKYWTRYFGGPERNGGLAREAVSDPRELHQLTAFFGWTAWASAALRPGVSHSDTNNFPYEPLAGNTLLLVR